MRFAVVLAVMAAMIVAACGGSDGGRSAAARPGQEPPIATPEAPPATPATPAEALVATSETLRAAIRAWLDRDDGASLPPADVTEAAAEHQRLYRRLAARPSLASRVVPQLHGRLRAEARDVIAARRAIATLNRPQPGQKLPELRVADPEPAAVIRGHYRAAYRRFGVPMPLLAAVHFVESRFGRVRNDSVAGAQGPMQFIPATWDAYGLGGDVHEPRDAILGAANYLRANGAPGDERGALFHYNPSSLYVDAVARYARRIRRDPLAFYVFYAWPVPGR